VRLCYRRNYRVKLLVFISLNGFLKSDIFRKSAVEPEMLLEM